MKLATWIRSTFILLGAVLVCVYAANAATIARGIKPNGTTAWKTDDQFTPDDINYDFDTIYNLVNGNLDSANISASGFNISIITDGCGSDGGSACTDPLGFDDLNDYSDTEAEANNEKDPGDSDTPILSTDGTDELETLRYAIRRLGTGINVWRENGALVSVDWWELPVRGPNLVLNPSFQHDDDADGTADNWTLVDGGGGPTDSLEADSQAEGYGLSQRIQDATGGGDGIRQVVGRLKASTRYLILARVKVLGAPDITELTTSGALAASEWDDIVTARSIDFDSTSYETKGAVVLTDGTPTDITISLLSTAAADDFNVSDVAMYELNEDWMPFQRTGFSSHVTVDVKQDCAGAPAYVAVTNLAKTIIVPGPDYMVSVDATVSMGDGAATNYQTACQLKEGASVVSGPISTYIRSGTGDSASMHYVNNSPTAGASLAYTVECYCPTNNLDFQVNYAGASGQTESELSIMVQPK
jgi:hypothetical protein